MSGKEKITLVIVVVGGIAAIYAINRAGEGLSQGTQDVFDLTGLGVFAYIVAAAAAL